MSDSDPELSRLYRDASAEAPPASVDAAILAAARRQAVKPRRAARSSWVRWMAPVSALATLVVAVSLAFLVEREQPETTRDMRIHPITPRPPGAVPERATESTRPKAADRAAPAAAAKPEAPAADAPAPAARLPEQAPAAASPAPVMRPAEPAPPAAQAFPAERRAKAAESKVSAPAAAETKTLRESNVAGDAAQRGAGTAPPAAPAAAPGAPVAAGRLAPLPQQAMQRSPEAWLAEISRLRREGRDKEAAEQLAEFRKAYPAYALPEALSTSP